MNITIIEDYGDPELDKELHIKVSDTDGSMSGCIITSCFNPLPLSTGGIHQWVENLETMIAAAQIKERKGEKRKR